MLWFHELPVVWMSLVVFAAVGVVATLIYWVVLALAARGHTAAFKAVSPVMLTPLAVVFGLIVGFMCAQVWTDADRANGAVVREAGALRGVLLLATDFPAEEASIRTLVRRHIQNAVEVEWPAMARQDGALPTITAADTEALQVILALNPRGVTQETAQREMIDSLRNALDARRERIIISKAKINWVKWTVVLLLGSLILVTVAMVHSDNRLTAAIAMAIFAVAGAACVVLIASHNRPFTGEISVGPDLLVQIMPKD